MKKSGFLVILAFVLFTAVGMFPSLSMADEIIAVPEELGGGYLISTEKAIETGLVIPEAPEAPTPRNLTVIITGTAGSVKSSPKGINTCVHTGDVTPTTCGPIPFTARGITLHAYPDPITSTATAVLDWQAITATGTADISKRCKHESPTCNFNLTSDMTVTATFGTDPVAKITPATDVTKPYKFGKVKVGKTKAATFTVANKGVTNLTISTITSSEAQYTIPATINSKAADKCTGMTLAPKKTCTFKVVFTPTAASTTPVTGTITVTSNDDPASAYVSGIGN